MEEILSYEDLQKLRPPPQWWAPQIDRKDLKDLMQRNNYRALLSHGLYFAILIASGSVAAALYGRTYWSILAFFVYGTLFGMCNSRVHESLHGTPFKTQFLNEIVYFIGSCMEIRGTLVTRWSHMVHHSYTSLLGSDTEVQAPRPVKMWKLALDFFYLYSLYFLLKTMFMHTLGIPTEVARRVVPEDQLQKVFWSDRACLVVHAAVIVLAVVLHSWLPILLFTLPRLYGGWLIWALILAQHSGLAQDVIDHRLSTRTIRLNPFLSFLYMHMEYHTEHHLYPNIPFHALARFRHTIEAQMPRANSGLWDTYREMLPVLWKQRRDAGYFIRRELPGGNAEKPRGPNASETTGPLTWHVVCALDELELDDVLRFDVSGKVYAVYHTQSGFYATDGLCTHEGANLAEGYVSGEYLTCPKHTARFHIPTGKVIGAPARIDLATYPVKTEDGKVYLGLPG